jgi:hypothetical protein
MAGAPGSQRFDQDGGGSTNRAIRTPLLGGGVPQVERVAIEANARRWMACEPVDRPGGRNVEDQVAVVNTAHRSCR